MGKLHPKFDEEVVSILLHNRRRWEAELQQHESSKQVREENVTRDETTVKVTNEALAANPTDDK